MNLLLPNWSTSQAIKPVRAFQKQIAKSRPLADLILPVAKSGQIYKTLAIVCWSTLTTFHLLTEEKSMPIILVIEDDTDYRRSLIEILRLENYRILEAVNGLHGLEMLRSHSLDLIISDLEMPVMDGIELLRIVKEEAAFSHIPFIMVTGHRNEAILKTVQELKPNACLFKPPNIDELLFTIDSCLRPKAS